MRPTVIGCTFARRIVFQSICLACLTLISACSSTEPLAPPPDSEPEPATEPPTPANTATNPLKPQIPPPTHTPPPTPPAIVRELGLPANWNRPTDLRLGHPARQLIGAWVQTGGRSDSDYARGGYLNAWLVFTGDSRLFTVRKAGEAHNDVTVTPYDVEGGQLALGPAEDELRLDEEPRSITLPDGTVRIITPPRAALPARFDYTLQGAQLRIVDKVFERLSR